MIKYFIFVSPYGAIRKTKKGSPLYNFEIDTILGYKNTKLFSAEVNSTHVLCVRLKNCSKWQKYPINKIPISNNYESGISFAKKWDCFFDIKNSPIIEIKIEQR